MNSTGKTPWNTLGTRLYVDVRDNDNTEFIKMGSRPARFFLKSRESELPGNVIGKIEAEENSIYVLLKTGYRIHCPGVFEGQ